MKKIKCTLGTIDRAIEEIERYEKQLKKKLHNLLERLGELGIEEASVRFANAVYDGDNDVKVADKPVWIDENKLAISASGNSITFIEFGTGVFYSGESHPKAAEFGFTRGSYGYHLGRLESWRYKGNPGTNGEVIESGEHSGEVKTHGNPANRSLYDTGKELREQIVKIAREVFSGD